MCDLICDVTSCSDSSCDTEKINVYDRIVIKNQKKYWNQSNYLNLNLKDGLRMEFTAC